MSMAPFTRVQMDRSIALAKAAGLRDYRRGAWWPDLAQCVVEYVHLMEDGTEIAPTSESFADEADVVSIATRVN
jgi:hypothetical protein